MRHVNWAVHVTVIPTGVMSFDGAVDDRRVVHDRGVLDDFFSPYFVSQIVFGPVNRSILFANILALHSSGWGEALGVLAVRLFLHHLSALIGRGRLDIAAIFGWFGL